MHSAHASCCAQVPAKPGMRVLALAEGHSRALMTLLCTSVVDQPRGDRLLLGQVAPSSLLTRQQQANYRRLAEQFQSMAHSELLVVVCRQGSELPMADGAHAMCTEWPLSRRLLFAHAAWPACEHASQDVRRSMHCARMHLRPLLPKPLPLLLLAPLLPHMHDTCCGTRSVPDPRGQDAHGRGAHGQGAV